jgi:hypothetical protein
MWSSQFPCYLIPLRPKYLPQHSILKHPEPIFLPQCERSSFSTTQNNRQSYSSVSFDLHIFGQQTVKQKILHQMIASIPQIKSACNFFIRGIWICYGCTKISELFHLIKLRVFITCLFGCDSALHTGVIT